MRMRFLAVVAVSAIAVLGYTARFLVEPSRTPDLRLPVRTGAVSIPNAVYPVTNAVVHTADANPLVERARELPRATVEVAVPGNDEDLINALRGAFGDPIQHRSEKAILDLLEFMTPENAERVRRVLSESEAKGVRLQFARKAFWTTWGEIDPSGAFTSALSEEESGTNLHNLFRGWSAVDPVSAERWLRENPDAPHYGSMVSALAANLAAINPSRTTEFVLSLPLDDESRQRCLSEIAGTLWKMSGPERLELWFEGLAEPTKQLAFNEAAGRIKDGDLEYAKQWFASQADKPWRDDDYYLELVQRYGVQDPAAAAAWVVSLPPRAGAIYPIGTSKVMEQWTLKDPPAASGWLTKHRREAWWPRAAKGYFNGLEKLDPAAALAFMDSLGAAERAAVEKDLQISK